MGRRGGGGGGERGVGGRGLGDEGVHTTHSTFKLVVVRVLHVEVILGVAPCTLVYVQPAHTVSSVRNTNHHRQ